MSLDAKALARALSDYGPLIRVVVAEELGSAPREVGAAMLVWPDGQEGTIGGGALEYEAVATARAMLTAGKEKRLSRHALGPDLGQCCGGAVRLFFEHWAAMPALPDVAFARPTSAGPDDMPLAVHRLIAAARGAGQAPAPQLLDGWFVEPMAASSVPVWIWGAGHVGRALVATLAPLPDLALTWLDTAPERFPDEIPDGVTMLPAPDLPAAMRLAPAAAHHLVLTYSHRLDLALCDAGLRHGFASFGLIGSATKWARFCSRLRQMGHERAGIGRIACPIGEKSLGKHPQAIAVGVAHTLLMELAKKEASGPTPQDSGDGDDARALDA